MHKITSLFNKTSTKQVGLYTITGALAKIVSFAALPFFVNSLSEGDIGILNIFSSTIVFLTPIISMGTLYSISVEYFKMPKREYSVMFSTALMIPLLLAGLLIPVIYIAFPVLESTFGFQPAFFWLIPTCLLLNFFFEAFIILLRVQNNVKLYSIVSLLKVIVEIILSILFVLYVTRTWYSRAMGYFISGLVIAILFFRYIYKQQFLTSSINTQAFWKEVSIGFSGLLLQTAVFFIGTADKFFVMANYGKDESGFYAVAATFATIQYIVSTSLIQYIQPIIYKKFAAQEKWHAVKEYYAKYAIAMLFSAVGLIGFAYFIYAFLLKPSYLEHISYFLILSFSSFLWSLSNISLQYIIFTRNKKIIIQLALCVIALSVIVNWWFSSQESINLFSFGQVIINLGVLLIIWFFNKKLNFFQKA